MSTLATVSVILSCLVSASTLLVLLRNTNNNRLARRVAAIRESEAVGQLKVDVADIKTRLVRIEMKVDRRRLWEL